MLFSDISNRKLIFLIFSRTDPPPSDIQLVFSHLQSKLFLLSLCLTILIVNNVFVLFNQSLSNHESHESSLIIVLVHLPNFSFPSHYLEITKSTYSFEASMSNQVRKIAISELEFHQNGKSLLKFRLTKNGKKIIHLKFLNPRLAYNF